MLRALIVATTLLTATTHPAKAQDFATQIVGTWKLKSFDRKELQTGKTSKFYGERPVGYSVYTKGGNFLVYMVAEGRKKPASSDATDAELAALYKTMYAYSGTYKVDGNKLILNLDGSWNEVWTGTQRTQTVQIEGNKLTLTSMPFKGAVTGVDIVVTNVLERLD
jgi:hypothetical protein